jgi:hypothetical protein
MDRLILLVSLFLSLGFALESHAEPPPLADIFPSSMEERIPFESDLSLFRYGAFGSGLFPSLSGSPGTPCEVRVNGVPLAPVSPFGPDLERVLPLLVDSLDFSPDGTITIATADSISSKPLTRFDFLSGMRRRAGFEGVFERPVTEHSGIRVFGMSEGIRGSETTGGNESRLYGVTWRRTLSERSAAFATLTGSRRKEDLFDLAARKEMGTFEEDETTGSVRVVNGGIDGNGVLSSTVYVRNGDIRSRRYGAGDSFDDDSFGGSVTLAFPEFGGLREIGGTFDSRSLGGEDDIRWRDSIVRVHGQDTFVFGTASLDVNGGISHSGRYGMGYDAEGRLGYPLSHGMTAILSGAASRSFPGPQHEFYPSLITTDSLRTTRLRRFNAVEAETGVEGGIGPVEFGFSAFTGSAEIPYLIVPPSLVSEGISDPVGLSGVRVRLASAGKGLLTYSADMKLDIEGGPGRKYAWPRPDLDCIARGEVSHEFVSGRLLATAFGRAHLEHFHGGSNTPDGVLPFLDAGLAVRVSTFQLTYTMENIADSDMRWFDTFGWQGRNAWWEIRLNLWN